MAVNHDDKNLALFCDFENIALGVRDAKYKKFNIQHVLQRLLVKGSIIVKKAYCDWDRYKEFKGPMHEAAFEMIEIPHVRMSGKNSADIRMVVDALDLCYTKSHVDTFVIISGDSDFSPLVSKLRENAKTVIGVGVKNSTSDLLINSCDEFIYYDDLVRELERQGSGSRSGRKRSGSRGGRGRRSEGETNATDTGSATEEVAAQPVAPADAAPDAAAPAAGPDEPSRESRPPRGGRRRRGGESSASDAGTDGQANGRANGRADTPAHAPADDSRDAPADTRASVPAQAKAAGSAPSATRDAGSEDDDEVGVVEFAVLDDEDDIQDEEGGSDTVSDDDEGAEDELQQEGIDLMIETATALSTERGGKDRLWGSMIKQALKRRRPGFNESYYGFDSFSKMLEEAESQGLLKLEPDDRSGGYIIRDITG